MNKIIIFLLIGLLLISGCNNNYFIEGTLEGTDFCENKDLSYSSRDFCSITDYYTAIRCKDNNNEIFDYKIECKPK